MIDLLTRNSMLPRQRSNPVAQRASGHIPEFIFWAHPDTLFRANPNFSMRHHGKETSHNIFAKIMTRNIYKAFLHSGHSLTGDDKPHIFLTGPQHVLRQRDL